MPEGKAALSCELVGIVFIVIIGTVLHFTFEFSGDQPLVGVFSAVARALMLYASFQAKIFYCLTEHC